LFARKRLIACHTRIHRVVVVVNAHLVEHIESTRNAIILNNAFYLR
jgi:hypothetical protein